MPKEYKFGPISFRLAPDAIKEEALNMVPWPVGTIAREMYRNPDGSIVETAKQVGRETPIIGSILSGEPTDALKEAVLFAAPVKAKTKQRIKNLGPDTRFYPDPNYYNGKMTDYANPVNGKNGYINQFADNYEFNKGPKNLNAQIGTPNIGMTEMLNSIDNSNAMHKLNGKNDRISYRNDYSELLNPYDISHLDDPAFANSPEGKLLSEGMNLNQRMNELRNYGLNVKQAEEVKSKLKPGESLVEDANGRIYILKGNDVYNLSFANDRRSTRFYKYDSNLSSQEISSNYKPYSSSKYDAAVKQMQNDIDVYNSNADFYETHVPLNIDEPFGFYDKLGQRKKEFDNTVYGPFMEDLLRFGR